MCHPAVFTVIEQLASAESLFFTVLSYRGSFAGLKKRISGSNDEQFTIKSETLTMCLLTTARDGYSNAAVETASVLGSS